MKDETIHTQIDTAKMNIDSGHHVLTVKNVIWLSPEIFELRLDRDNIAFLPGDCASIYGPDQKKSRPYSIASGRQDPTLNFVIRNMDEGTITHYLAELNPGDQVKISEPYGWFRPGQNNGSHPFIFVATGTGISPFLSYTRSYPEHPPQKILYGVRKFEDAVGYDYLQSICPIELSVSQEKKKNFHYGRVTDLVPHLPVTPETHFYLCGLDVMIEEVSEWLIAKGVRQANIHREVFFYASK